jgi:hypothetical protein
MVELLPKLPDHSDDDKVIADVTTSHVLSR